MKLTEEDRIEVERVYAAHRQRVFRTCFRFAAGDRGWALDRMHDTFETFAKNLHALDVERDLGGWLNRVAVRNCLMVLRRNETWLRVMPRLESRASDSPEAMWVEKRSATRVERSIAELPARERVLMTLMYLHDKTQVEAAELMGVSKGYASKLHSRAIKRLQTAGWEFLDVP